MVRGEWLEGILLTTHHYFTSNSSQRSFDQLDQVLHHEAMFGADVHAQGALVQVFGNDGAYGCDLGLAQAAHQEIIGAAFPGDLEEPTTCGEPGENDGVHRALVHLFKEPPPPGPRSAAGA